MKRFVLVGLGVAAFGLAAACGDDDKDENTDQNTGGTTAATGGTTAATGGTTAATGGTTAAGGGPESGGAPGTGGLPETGGAPGTGGALPDASVPPQTDGSAPPPPPEDAGFTPNPGTVDVVQCAGDGTSCNVGQSCCYTGGNMATHTCGDATCADGEVTIACDGREDCHGGQSCCRSGTGFGGSAVTFTCKDTCGQGTIVNCASPANCPSGTVCCQRQAGIGGGARTTECSDTCSGNGSYIMCAQASDCPPNAPNCSPSQTMPGFRYCSP